MSAPTATSARAGRTTGPAVPILRRPLTSYYLLVGSTALLLTIGLTMVLSASSVRSFAETGSSFTVFLRQAQWVILGVPVFAVASRLPVKFYRFLGYPLLLGSILLLALVLLPGLGHHVNGSTRWLDLPGGLVLQPSEFAKLGLVLWGADLLVRKERRLGEWRHLLVPLIPVSALIALEIMFEPDLGTTLVVLSVPLALLWIAGAPLRVFGTLAAGFLSLGALMIAVEPYRMERITGFLDPFAHPDGSSFQAVQAIYALSSGGLFGEGLGAGREKWAGGVPNAHTDFILAIIGEELGLVGTLVVLALFATLAYAGVRIAGRTRDPFVRLAAGAVTAWVLLQTLINVGAVVALLPITGIPLPLISFGGSALLPTLFALGMLASFARAEPGAPEVLRTRAAARRGEPR